MEPLSVYDAPSVVLKQVLDGQFTPRLAANAFFNPMELAPSERDTLATTLKEAAGKSSITHALIDTAMNPWVWFMFATSPLGEKPLGNIFEIAAKYSGYVVKNVPLLGAVGALTSGQALRGMRSGKAVNRFLRGVQEFQSMPEFKAFSEEMKSVLTANGLEKHGLDWGKYAEGSQEWTKARELSAALHAKWDNWDVNKARWFLNEAGDIERTQRPALVQMDPEAILNKYGAGGLANAWAPIRTSVRDKVFPDERAAQRVWSAVGGAYGEVTGKAVARSMVGDLMSDDVVRQMKAEGKVSGFLGAMREDQHFFPLNQTEVIKDGRRIRGSDFEDSKWAAAMRAGDSAIPRVNAQELYPLQDLQLMKEVLGATPELELKIANTAKLEAERTARGEALRYNRIRPDRSVMDYMDGMGRTYSLYVQDVGQEVRNLDKTLVGALKPWNDTSPQARSWRKSAEGKIAELSKTIGEIEGTPEEPLGGVTLADVFHADHGTAQNWWVRDTISKIAIPRMMGRISTESTGKLSAVLNTKAWMESFTNSAPGKAIENSGEFGNKFIGRLKNFGETTEASFEEGQKLERFLTKTIYSGHLGLNMMSAVLNMTQPFLFASTWGGAMKTIEAYGSAFAEFGNYVSKRIAQGFKPLSEYDRVALLKETHKFANFEGQDLLDMGGDMLHNLEGRYFSNLASGQHTPGMLDNLLFEMPMALFRSGELINRNVAAHVAGSLAKEGALSSEATASAVRDFVRETQYGGHWLNTPQAFLQEGAEMGGRGFPTGRLLANPLVRQFLSFPLRSFTSWAYTGPRLMGETNLMKNFAVQTLRGMGTSAIGYEVAKNLLGADISRAGFFGAATDIIPGLSGGRFQEKDSMTPFPVPPIFDIPLGIFRGVAGGDMEAAAQSAMRLLPNGVAISKALNVMPNYSALKFLGQKKYADWDNVAPDGTIGMYDDRGTLIDRATPLMLMMKGLGADFTRIGTKESEVMGYLVKQRENIVNARRDYMAATMRGDHNSAAVMQAQFKEKFGFPITVTKSQWGTMQRNRSLPRIDRAMLRIPQELRPQFQEQAKAYDEQRSSAAPMVPDNEWAPFKREDFLP